MAATAQLNRPISDHPIAARGLAAAAASTAINLIVAQRSRAWLEVPAEFQPLQPGPVGSLTAVSVMAATGVYGVLASRGSARERLFIKLSAAVAIVSLLGPLRLLVGPETTLPGVTGRGVAALVPLHLLPAGLTAWMLTRRSQGTPA